MDGPQDAAMKLFAPTLADMNLDTGILNGERNSHEDPSTSKASAATHHIHIHIPQADITCLESRKNGSANGAGIMSRDASMMPCHASEATGLRSGRREPNFNSLGTSLHQKQNMTGQADQTTVNLTLRPQIPVPTSLPEMCQGDTKCQLSRRRSKAFHFIETISQDLMDDISQVFDFAQVMTEPTQRPTSQAFNFIPNSSEQEVQGTHTDGANFLQPNLEVENTKNFLHGIDCLFGSEPENYFDNVHNSVGNWQLQTDHSPIAASPGDELSSHELYPADSPGILSPPVEGSKSNTILETVEIPAEAGEDHGRNLVDLGAVVTRAQQEPLERDREAVISAATDTTTTTAAADTTTTTAATDTTTTTTASEDCNKKRAKSKRRSRKMVPQRERAYERQEPYGDKVEERRRQDAIRAKKCRDKHKEETKKLKDDYNDVCKERDHLASELEGVRHSHRALLHYLKTKYGIAIPASFQHQHGLRIPSPPHHVTRGAQHTGLTDTV